MGGLWTSVLEALPPEIVDDAIWTGGEEPLWSEPAALEVVEWARRSTAVVIGGEVYRSIGPMRTVFISDWSIPEGRQGETRRECADRAGRIASAAILRARDGRPGRRYFLALDWDAPPGGIRALERVDPPEKA